MASAKAREKSKATTGLEEYTNTIIAMEKKEYHPDLKPFAVREKEIRERLGTAFRSFQSDFLIGYQTLLEALKHEMESGTSKEDLLALAQVDIKNLGIFQDPAAMMQAISQGSFFYEMLGFSEHALTVFYITTGHLMKAGEFQKAKEICAFLTVIAPQVYPFWLRLGECRTHLTEYDEGLLALFQAIDLNPSLPAAYEQIIDTYMQMNDLAQAATICSAGVHFAEEHHKESWAEPLRLALEEKRQHITKK